MYPHSKYPVYDGVVPLLNRSRIGTGISRHKLLKTTRSTRGFLDTTKGGSCCFRPLFDILT